MNEDVQLISKLTEKEYQKIAKIGDSLTNINEMYLLGSTESETLYSKLIITHLSNDLSFRDYEQIILAIANPLTREWAHDKYVEKEKKYLWSSKKVDRDNNVLTLYKDEEGMVSTTYRKVSEPNLRNGDNYITESDLREWGYNPEMFDKEEGVYEQ